MRPLRCSARRLWMEYIGVGMEVDRRVAADSIRVRSWQEVLRYSAGDRGGRTLVQLDEDIAKCTAKQRGYNALPPADHVIHYLVYFAAEQDCDVIVYSMNDQDVVQEIIFLKRGKKEPPMQRAGGGDDAPRQTAVFVSAGTGATHRNDAGGISPSRSGTAGTNCWLRFSNRAAETAMLSSRSREFLFGSGCRDAIAAVAQMPRDQRRYAP